MKRSRKPIPFRSAKRAAIADERRAFVDRILSERPQCEAGHYLRPIVGTLVGKDQDRVLAALRGCTWKSTEVHELLSRARGDSIVEDANCMSSCAECVGWIGGNKRLARMAGMATRRYTRRNGRTQPKADQVTRGRRVAS